MPVQEPVLNLYIQGEGSNACTGTCTKFVYLGRRESVCLYEIMVYDIYSGRRE